MFDSKDDRAGIHKARTIEEDKVARLTGNK